MSVNREQYLPYSMQATSLQVQVVTTGNLKPAESFPHLQIIIYNAGPSATVGPALCIMILRAWPHSKVKRKDESADCHRSMK